MGRASRKSYPACMTKLFVFATMWMVGIAQPGFAQTSTPLPYAGAVGFPRPNAQLPRDSTRRRVFGPAVNEKERLYFRAGSAAGALAGAVVAGAVLWKCSDCKRLPVAAIAVGTGTIGGGLLGSLFYRMREIKWPLGDPPRPRPMH
jgi:hypothetical protein